MPFLRSKACLPLSALVDFVADLDSAAFEGHVAVLERTHERDVIEPAQSLHLGEPKEHRVLGIFRISKSELSHDLVFLELFEDPEAKLDKPVVVEAVAQMGTWQRHVQVHLLIVLFEIRKSRSDDQTTQRVANEADAPEFIPRAPLTHECFHVLSESDSHLHNVPIVHAFVRRGGEKQSVWVLLRNAGLEHPHIERIALEAVNQHKQVISTSCYTKLPVSSRR